uniref:Chaperone DnaJ C-terminal domain-containing protein n=1 Tax=viral metagenome TaxID=1070528 RepID=A0A6C0IAU8_9ZZZZ
MANEIANNMSTEDKENMENMDMEKMITHVTKNIFKMMNNNPENQSELIEEPEEPKKVHKTRDICFDLNVDLEDLYLGKKKKLNVKRKTIIDNKVVDEKKKFSIPIEKGMKDEQQIRFEEEADELPGYTQGDLVITLIENEHPEFQRDGDNLVYIKNINIYEMYNLSFDIKHLDNRVLRIEKYPEDCLYTTDSIRKIPGEGMPKYKKPNEFGDLYIRFNLVIPKSLSESNLIKLKEIFGESESLSDTFDKNYFLENDDTEEDDTDYSTETSESSESGESLSDESNI